MKKKAVLLSFRRYFVLTLCLTLCAGLLSGCDLTQMIIDGTDLIDKLAQSSTDPSAAGNQDPTDFTWNPNWFPTPSTQPQQATKPDSTEPPLVTEPAATEPTYSTDPEDIRYGIVTAESASFYAQANQASAETGLLRSGSRIEIFLIDKGWVRTAVGWGRLEDFYIEGTTGEYAVGASTVTGTDVNLRMGPARSYEPLGRHNTGDMLNILEEIYNDGLWWGYTGYGWICMDYVYVNGTMSENYGTAIVTGDVVNVRSGPGTKYGVVGSVKENQVLEVYNFITIKGVKWACIDKGWVCMDYLRYTAN